MTSKLSQLIYYFKCHDHFMMYLSTFPGVPNDLLYLGYLILKKKYLHSLQALSRLSCAFKTENQTRLVVCDLGNPMKAGTKVRMNSSLCLLSLGENPSTEQGLLEWDRETAPNFDSEQ